ncbi:MAG: tetratricopeptide repeat protein [Coriobacteriaceae bacterium]|nr:tetratricopeptide repeat protein [Coriobacteriaceae bacterium]
MADSTRRMAAEDVQDADEFFDDEQELMAASEGAGASDTDGAAGEGPSAADDSAALSGAASSVAGSAAGREPASNGSAAACECSAAAFEHPAEDPSSRPAPDAPTRTAPPFWMVLAIAGVALVLGIVIGYLMGTSATISQLADGEAQAGQSASASGDGVSMPEGHPDLTVNEDGTASVSDDAADAGGTSDAGTSATASDPLTLANNYFDMGMSALQNATDSKAQAQAAELFRQAIVHYDEYLATNSSPSAEVDRAICVFYAGDHEAAIADLEAFTKKDATFAPAWANLGMFYEAHGDTSKAIAAYEHALKAAEKEDAYGVKDYAQQHLDALKSK